MRHLAHQRERFVGDVKTQVGEASGEAGHAQYAQRIFAESVGNVAQHARLQVGHAAVWVNQLPFGGAGDGVDGQIAPQQIFFQRHVRRGIAGKTGVPLAGFALGARQRVLLMRIGVEEHREIFADLLITQCQQLRRRGAHHHPIMIDHRDVEQAVANGTADQINLHC